MTMVPRPTSPIMSSLCGRDSPASPPSVVAPMPIKPPSLSESQVVTSSADQQQRLLYQLALAERLRLASAGLAWARPPMLSHQHPHLAEPSTGSLMGGGFVNGLGFPTIGGIGSVAFGGSVIGAATSHNAYAPTHPLYGYRLLDPRMLLPRGPEEPKPQHSYIGLIAMAILSSPDKKLILSDIYQYILDHYPYFRTRGNGWRNSIRHNLSLNDCFMKSGRSANGKGHYWAIHPANIDDFRRGDFRRRRAQRRVRKHMGLAVDDDSEPETLSPPPPSHVPSCHEISSLPAIPRLPTTEVITNSKCLTRPKRQFDVLSLLAPDVPRELVMKTEDENSQEESANMEVSSGGLMSEGRTQMVADPHLRVADDLRLQVREVNDDATSSKQLRTKPPCLPLSPSEEDQRRGEKVEETVDDEEEDDVEKKCIPIFHANQKINSNTLGELQGQANLLSDSRESPSPPGFLTTPWHSPTSPLGVPVTSSVVGSLHHSNPTLPPGLDLVSSSIRSYAANLTQTHVSKPMQNLPSTSTLGLNHPLIDRQSPNLSSNLTMNLGTYSSILQRPPQTSSNSHLMSLALSEGSNGHSEQYEQK